MPSFHETAGYQHPERILFPSVLGAAYERSQVRCLLLLLFISDLFLAFVHLRIDAGFEIGFGF